MTDPYEWVSTRRRVEAVDGTGVVVAAGTAVAYTPHPTVVIEDDQGRRVHWDAYMTREAVTPAEDLRARIETAVHDGLRDWWPVGQSGEDDLTEHTREVAKGVAVNVAEMLSAHPADQVAAAFEEVARG